MEKDQEATAEEEASGQEEVKTAEKEVDSSEAPIAPEAAESIEEEQPKVAIGKPKISIFQKLADGIKGLTGVTHNQTIRDGYRFLKQKQYQQAVISFQTAIKENESNVEGYLGIAQTLLQKGGVNNAKNAITYIQQGIQKNPFKFELYEEAIKTLEKLGKSKEAANERKRLHTVKMLKNEPNNAIANNNMGIISLKQKQFEQAIDYFTKATKYKSDYPVAHLNLAKAWYQKARSSKEDKAKAVESAKQALSKAMAIDNSGDKVLLLARILILEEKYDEALKQCDVAYKMDAGNKDVFGVKQLCNEKLANLEEANMDYQTYKSLEKAEHES